MEPETVLIVMAILASLTIVALAIKSMLVVPTDGKVFVRDAWFAPKVLRRPSLVIQWWHTLEPVLLTPFEIPLDFTSTGRVITTDRFLLECKAKAIVCVKDDDASVINAAKSLERWMSAGRATSDGMIDIVLRQAIRMAAARNTMMEIHTEREAFFNNVSVMVMQDLANYGLELESLEIYNLNQVGVWHPRRESRA